MIMKETSKQLFDDILSTNSTDLLTDSTQIVHINHSNHQKWGKLWRLLDNHTLVIRSQTNNFMIKR